MDGVSTEPTLTISEFRGFTLEGMLKAQKMASEKEVKRIPSEPRPQYQRC